ncbi:MAG TPA: hypothetical protein DHW22_03425 [Planctomycetaceae bacterium]|nr:hypothetical protein [Planctomycetaceae bacterium]
MGIRFTCPKGHPLHVKEFLAGKRGICPECDTRFVIPAIDGRATSSQGEGTHGVHEAPKDVNEVSKNEVDLIHEAGSVRTATPPPQQPLASSPLPPAIPPETAGPTTPPPVQEVWYVRTVSGEQYGPATTELMHTWVQEGRVLVDSQVWRTGWPEWKTGHEAVKLFQTPTQELSEEIAMQESLPTFEFPQKHRHRKRSRRDRAKVFTIALGGLVLLLLIAFLLVVSNN